jgi:HEAT repeat protein
MILRNTAAVLMSTVLIVSFTAVPDAGAIDDARAAQQVVESLDRLGAVPSVDAVLGVARKARGAGETTAMRAIAVLRTCRGHAAARGLGILVAHTSPTVREAALEAIAENAVRVAETLPEVRELLACEDDDVRAAAFAAVGAVGDASDVPTLLSALHSGDPDVIRCAYDALRTLSGARLAYREGVWARWWKETRETAPARLTHALEVLEKSEDETALADARALVVRCGWMDLASVGARVTAWLDAPDPRLRSDAYSIAAKLRLGDVAQALEWALGFESDPRARELGIAAAKVLGVRTDRAARQPSR